MTELQRNAERVLERELARFAGDPSDLLNDDALARMISLGERCEHGVADAIAEGRLPWHVTRLGCRVEYLFRPERPVTGSDAAAGAEHLLGRLIHLYALNRRVLLTPFHNMALISPATTTGDVDTDVFREAVREFRAG